jgi:hypothetical protein
MIDDLQPLAILALVCCICITLHWPIPRTARMYRTERSSSENEGRSDCERAHNDEEKCEYLFAYRLRERRVLLRTVLGTATCDLSGMRTRYVSTRPVGPSHVRVHVRVQDSDAALCASRRIHIQYC